MSFIQNIPYLCPYAEFWKDQIIPIELKMHHNARSQPDGLRQLARYMDKLGQQRGYLILFEKKSSEELPWETCIRREIHELAKPFSDIKHLRYRQKQLSFVANWRIG